MNLVKRLYNSKYKDYIILKFSIIFKKDIKLTDIIINKYIKQGYSDYIIFKILHSYYWKNRIDYDKLKEAKLRSIKKTNEIKNLLKGLKWNKTNYLDIGCEDCYFPTELGEILEISEKNINCVNIMDWESSYNINKSEMNKCNFKYYNGTYLDYENNYFSVISSMMVLHHIKPEDRLKLYKSINRVLEKDGLFIIREHNSIDKEFNLYLDFIHRFYESILIKKFRWVEEYKTYYMTIKDLEKELNNNGFKLLKIEENKYKNDLPYNAIYKKI
jgi:SAM-dependent methyltransferase